MRLGTTGRLLLIVLAAMLPPLVLLALADAWAASLTATGEQTIRLGVVSLTFLWAGVVAVAGARFLTVDASSLLALTEHRDAEPRQGPALDRVALALDRRDEQLQTLAAEIAAAPIAAGAHAVASHVVRTARRVTGDKTWHLAVQGDGGHLAAGAYDGESSGPEPISDLHRWASVKSADSRTGPMVAQGPWGAFMLVALSGTQDHRALLLAPWEGRPPPTPAERALLVLVAEHATGALDHAVLFERVRRQAEELDRLAAIQKDFLRGVTHDLQSPLASISATAADLRARQASRQELQGELETIESQAERLGRMVSQLLTMSGIEAGVVAPRAEVFRASGIVRRVVESLRQPAERITITSSGADRLVIGDPDRLEQVLWAVLDNALKYSPADAPIEVALTVRVEHDAAYEEIAVSDRGIGMDADTESRAFEQFYRADRARDLVPNGSGIGLFTARALMGLMGGAIHAESRLGQGTTMRLQVPVELTEATETEARQDERTGAP